MPLLKLSKGKLQPTLEASLNEVTVKDWRQNPQNHADATALIISNDMPIESIACDLSGFDVVVLDFPTFKDGRAYSQARLLRERFEYAGEIRVRGEVLRDQIFFMVRCGVDAFEFDSADINGAEAALSEFNFTYQPAADGTPPVWRRRLQRAAAA